MEKNVNFEDITVVNQSTVYGYDADDLFTTKDKAIKWTTKKLIELSEEFSDEEMKKYGFDKDPEDYVEVIDFKHLEEHDGIKRRASTDFDGKLIIECFDNRDGEWHEFKDLRNF